MKNSLFRPLAFAFLTLTGALVSGCGVATHSSSAALAPPTPTQMLDAIPPPGDKTASDRGIAKWMAKVRANDADDKAWVNLGDVLGQRVRETTDASYYDYAERAYTQALARNPKNVDAMTGLSWVWGGRHIFPKSVEWAKKALVVEPKNNIAYGLLGDADTELGEYDQAFKDYQTMLDIRPDLSSYSRGAHLLYLTGDTRKGIWLMAKAIKAGAPYAENTAWCRAQLGQMLLDDGAVVPAEGIVQDGLKTAPNNIFLLIAMGKAKTATKNYAAATEYYKKAVAVAPEHNALVALGDLAAIQGDKAGAERWYAQVEALHAKNMAGGLIHDHMQMAQFYADHDRNLVEAVRLAEEHKLSKNVNDADTLAWCYYKTNENAQAKTAIDRALARNTPDARIYFHAGMIAARAGDRIDAKKYLGESLNLSGTSNPLQSAAAASELKTLGSVASSKG